MPIPSNPEFLESVIGEAADVLPIPAQDYTDPTQNGALNYQTGWPAITALPLEAGGKAPRREYFNALIQIMSSHIFFQQSGSLYPWSATLDYLSGAHVLGSDGKEYIAQKSNGPDVPDSSAVDPVGDESGTWLPAGSVYAPLATPDTPGIVQPDNETITIKNGIISATLSQTFAASWIGVPRPWRSTTLPPNYCWANGDFVAFADWPELEQVYATGGFEGMLMAWDADSDTQAANIGQWRPDAAEPTGLYTPTLGGQFLRAWEPGQAVDSGRTAGAAQKDAVQTGITGISARNVEADYSNPAVVVAGNVTQSYDGVNTITLNQSAVQLNMTLYTVNQRTASETRPLNVAIPMIIYLGNPAS